MALSSTLLSKGLVNRSVTNPFGRSPSCDDLGRASGTGSDGIQVYVSSVGRHPPIRMFATDAIASVNVKIRSPSRGFYLNQQGIFSGSTSSDDIYTSNAGAPHDMRFVLGLADLLFVSVSTFSGKEYIFSVEAKSSPSVRELKERLLEHESEGSPDDFDLVPASGGRPLLDHELVTKVGKPGRRHLFLVADRSSRVCLRPRLDNSMELSVRAPPGGCAAEVTPISPGIAGAQQDLLPARDVEESRMAIGLDLRLCDDSRQGLGGALLARVDEGLAAGYQPQLTEEGSGGTYFMPDSQGKIAAVFKPVDEEPLALNCPRGATPSSTGEGLKRGTRVGEGAYREVAAYLLDHCLDGRISKEGSRNLTGFSGVPPTVLARCSSEFFPMARSGDVPDLPTLKLGSLQQFVPSVSNCEDMGPQHFPVREVHKIAVLDMRIANTDRNGANILVQRDGSDVRLIPIDHGYCLPETLEECTFEWLYWPQAKLAFAPETLKYISRLDPEGDVELLQRHGWAISPAAARVLVACTTLLKRGAAAGLTPFELGSLMVRSDPQLPSALEEMVEETEALLDRNSLGSQEFSNILACVVDAHLNLT